MYVLKNDVPKNDIVLYEAVDAHHGEVKYLSDRGDFFDVVSHTTNGLE